MQLEILYAWNAFLIIETWQDQHSRGLAEKARKIGIHFGPHHHNIHALSRSSFDFSCLWNGTSRGFCVPSFQELQRPRPLSCACCHLLSDSDALFVPGHQFLCQFCHLLCHGRAFQAKAVCYCDKNVEMAVINVSRLKDWGQMYFASLAARKSFTMLYLLYLSKKHQNSFLCWRHAWKLKPYIKDEIPCDKAKSRLRNIVGRTVEEITSCVDIQIWERSKLRTLLAENALSWERSKLRVV